MEINSWCWIPSFCSLNGQGYSVKWGQKYHRYMYEKTHGPIPKGSEIHHRCGFRACCELSHLQVVTPMEHRDIHYPHRKGKPFTKKYCPRGHRLNKQNCVPADLKQGRKVCLNCHIYDQTGRWAKL